MTAPTTCRHCQRRIVKDNEKGWIDPEANGDDAIWRETCDAHDTFEADHEPALGEQKYTVTREVVETIEVEAPSWEEAEKAADACPIDFWERDIKSYETSADAPPAPAGTARADARS